MNRPSSSAASTVSGPRTESGVPWAQELLNSGDPELEDLIFSWRRVTDPRMRRIALQVVRSMES
jgi:hypothetical protein